MKLLILGGTGVISTSVTALALARGWDVTLLHRSAAPLPEALTGAHSLIADAYDEASVQRALGDAEFDAVAQFLGYTAEDAQRDVRLFTGRTKQYLFISTAAAYQKPLLSLPITESTPQVNPYSPYARGKIAAEEVLRTALREDGFPVTIVRPSHTYCERKVPVAVHGKHGTWQVLRRMMEGKPVIIHGDGTTTWALTHARDFAVGFVGLAGNPHAIGQAVHITTDETMTWRQIYGVIADSLGVSLNAAYVPSDLLAACQGEYDYDQQLIGDKSWSVAFDNSKIKQLVPDFHCATTMAQGLREAVAYTLAHEELHVEDPAFDTWCDRMAAAQRSAREAFLQG